jgi:hypothetical protein
MKKALAVASAFFNEAHLRCMKNEVVLQRLLFFLFYKNILNQDIDKNNLL